MNINWGLMGIWLICILFWVNVWFNGWWGLFGSTMTIIILSAIVGLWLRLSGRA